MEQLEEEGFDIELDEETLEVVLIHHYRRKWGHELDADIEHRMNMEEAMQLVVTVLQMIEIVRNKVIQEKVLVVPEEGNPLQNNSEMKGG